MKKTICYLLGSVLLLGACQQKKSNLQGTLTGVKSDTILVYSAIPGQRGLTTDTVALKDGKFALNIPDSVLTMIYIQPKPVGNEAMMSINPMDAIVMLPGNELKVSGAVDKMEVTGSEFYKEKNAFSLLDESKKQQQDLIAEYQTLSQEGKMNDSIENVMSERMDQINANMNQIVIAYIKEHPDNELSAYLFGLYGNYDVVDQTMDLLSEKLKTGPFKEMIQKSISNYESMKVKKEAEMKLQPGMPAPDFTLKNAKGEEVSLSSFKGKYVVIDFWGIWCKWCVKGIPEMKTYYEKYKKQLEIVGVDCGDAEDKWMEYIKENNLPWVNLYNGKDTVVTNMYAVAGFPTKVVIDKEGNIVKIIVGESPEFYELLDSLMGKK